MFIIWLPEQEFQELVLRFRADRRLRQKTGKRGIRLDCQLGNEPLNRFYERNGYVTVGEPFTAGGYTGIRKVLEF